MTKLGGTGQTAKGLQDTPKANKKTPANGYGAAGEKGYNPPGSVVSGATSRDMNVAGVEYQWPTAAGRITSAFGNREDAVPNPHLGIDIAPMTPGRRGQDILSVERGTVIVVGKSGGGSSEIHIEHANGEVSVYKHHDVESVRVKVGAVSARGRK